MSYSSLLFTRVLSLVLYTKINFFLTSQTNPFTLHSIQFLCSEVSD